MFRLRSKQSQSAGEQVTQGKQSTSHSFDGRGGYLPIEQSGQCLKHQLEDIMLLPKPQHEAHIRTGEAGARGSLV